MDWGNSLHVDCKASRKPSSLCWLGWTEFTVISPSLFFLFQPWLIRHHLGEFQTIRKDEGSRDSLLIKTKCFLRRKLKYPESTTGWWLVQMHIHEHQCCFHWQQSYHVVLVVSGKWPESPFDVKLWFVTVSRNNERWKNSHQHAGTGCPCHVWDYFAATCCCSVQEQGISKKWALGGDVQVAVPLIILTAASASSDYTVTHGKHPGMILTFSS